MLLPVDVGVYHVTCSGQWDVSLHDAPAALGDWACWLSLVRVPQPRKEPPPGAAATQPEP